MKKFNPNNQRAGIKYDDIPDWPDHISKPELPPGYSWLCLRPALGVKRRSWWVRVLRKDRKGNRRRVVKSASFDGCTSPRDAIQKAMRAIELDVERLSGK